MRIAKLKIESIALLGMLCASGSAFADEQKLFAAPNASAPAVASPTGSMMQATLALALVVAAVFAAAWALKRLRKFSGGGNAAIEIVSQVALGAKERAVLLKVAGTHVLVGVAPGRVNLLHTLATDTIVPVSKQESAAATQNVATNMPSFKALLKQSLGMK